MKKDKAWVEITHEGFKYIIIRITSGRSGYSNGEGCGHRQLEKINRNGE
jgi:hypothetical protein